ncbi:MAG: dTMP kinase [Acidimicrobiia bacterium]|nr:dTMP kinase [Acidimicrobiia bacterium]
MSRGLYIALEGVEGVGKSTVAAALKELIEEAGHEVMTVREPGGTATGERIRHVLLNTDDKVSPWTEALLFAAARSQLATEVVESALAAGTWVISDRSVYSSLAYQGGGRGLGVAEVRAVNEPGLGGTWPDVVALLRLDVGEGLARQEDPDRIGAAGRDFLEVVAETFEQLAQAEPDRVAVIDASLPVADVARAIWKVAVDRSE